MAEIDKNNSVFTKLTLRQGYILALCLIMVFAVLKYATLEITVMRQESAATVINISGRQRMLSQRIAFLASSYMRSTDRADKTRLAKKLRVTMNEFEQSSLDLIEGNPKRNLPPLTNAAIKKIYEGSEGQDALNILTTNYLEAARNILDKGSENDRAASSMAYIEQIGLGIMLEKLNEVVMLHEQEAQHAVKKIQYLQFLFLLSTLLILLLEGLVLFRPLVGRYEKNIKELKKREQQIKDQINELKRFAYIASHDLQEPLRKIGSFTGRLEKAMEGRLDDKAKSYIGFVLSGVENMRERVRGLYTYSEILAAEDNLEEVDCNLALKQALKELQEEIGQTQAVIEHETLPVVIYNRTMMIQLFVNLIENAIKFKSEAPLQIKITAQETEEEWIFCVADNGIGIDEKYHGRIFEMFQRLHRKEDIPGIGLSLTTSKKIVERFGGRIWIEAEPETGSAFYYTIKKLTKEKR